MIMVSKPNKLILDSIAKVKGISIDDVKEDLNKKKVNRKRKSKKKKKLKEGPSVELISDKNLDAKTINFSQIINKSELSYKYYRHTAINKNALFVLTDFSSIGKLD